MAASARRRRSPLGRPRSSANSSTLPWTVRQGSRVGSWNTYPIFLVWTSTVPPVAWVRFEAIRSSVLLPQPEGPITLTNSPGGTWSSTPASAVVPSGNRLVTPLKVSSGSACDATDEVSTGLDSAD